jgi:hypothetical protein|nr:MAG TPA: P-loop ATPase protein family [Caudoviricetes sp.]
MKKQLFDFQMFEEKQVLNIEGIDHDVLQALAEEENLTDQEAETEVEPSAVGAEDTKNVQGEAGSEDESAGNEGNAPDADADSDNKQVEEQSPKGTAIPYPRFKQEIDKRKAAEAELAALKARMQPQVPQEPAGPITKQPPMQNQGQEQVPNKAEIMKAVTSEAIRRAKSQMGLTDDELANMDFADNIERKKQFDLLVQQESNEILEAGRQIAHERVEKAKRIQSATEQFTGFVNEFQGKPDAAERWQYISEERFLQLPPLEQSAIKAAFERLQRKQGMPEDYVLARYYFDQASAEYDAQHKAQISPQQENIAAKNAAVNVAAKIEAAQALPKATQVSGAGKTTTMSADDVARILNEPGADALDKLPPEILKKVLAGIPLE